MSEDQDVVDLVRLIKRVAREVCQEMLDELVDEHG